MSETGKRRVGRPSTQVVTRDRIIDAALKIIDEQGNVGFVMRDIARELGVRPSALYNHVSSRDDIIHGIRERVGERISYGTLHDLPWDEALARWAHRYRDAFVAHPPTIALLAVMPIQDGVGIAAAYEELVTLLVRAGWGRDEVLDVVVALESFILGSALDAAAPADMLDPGERDDAPEFTAAYRARQQVLDRTGAAPADLAFEHGLRLLLHGLRFEKLARDGGESPHAE